MIGILLKHFWMALPLAYLFLSEARQLISLLTSSLDPSHGQLIRTNNCTSIFDQHETLGFVAFPLDKLTLAEETNVQIGNQGE